ncbi:MAG: rhomboid family intramembrane serine protease [Xanthobacteraceae bacterium]
MDAPRERIFNVPGVVLALVALLALLHVVLAFGLTESETNDVLRQFAFTPLRYVSDAPSDAIPNWWGPQLWTFVSYALLHADLNHLFFNLIWLLAFGVPVARRFGAARFLVFCAATAAAGALAHLATHWGSFAPMIGASGAVSGAMAGAMRFVFQRGGPLGLLGRGDDEAYRVPAAPLTAMLRDPRALGFLAVWFGVNLLFGVGAVALPGVDGAVAWQAHLGGFLAGLLGFALFDPVPPGGYPTPPEEPAGGDGAPADKPLN